LGVGGEDGFNACFFAFEEERFLLGEAIVDAFAEGLVPPVGGGGVCQRVIIEARWL